LDVLLGVLGALLVVATALPMWKRQSWWVRGFDFPRLQITAALVVVGIAHAVVADRGPWAYALWFAMGLSLAVQLRRMAPYTRLASPQVQASEAPDPDNGIRLLFANVLQDNANFQGLLEIVREADPDLVLALETDDKWANALAVLSRTHPHAVLHPLGNTYGMLLYSRLELLDAQVRFLIQADVPSIHARVRLHSGREVQLHCLHPRPPAPAESDSSAQRDAELLIVGRAIRKQPGPVIVMGDMNDVAWSHTTHLFQRISGLLDPRVGRGFFNTFNARHRLVRFPLDHFFHSNDFRLVSFRRLGYFGSDHFPVFIHLSHEPPAQQEQPEEQPDAADRAEAQEKVAAVNK
jgi:endonuclease/exonuclease/phosphatase (EEP) superfamily protein YafD